MRAEAAILASGVGVAAPLAPGTCPAHPTRGVRAGVDMVVTVINAGPLSSVAPCDRASLLLFAGAQVADRCNDFPRARAPMGTAAEAAWVAGFAARSEAGRFHNGSH